MKVNHMIVVTFCLFLSCGRLFGPDDKGNGDFPVYTKRNNLIAAVAYFWDKGEKNYYARLALIDFYDPTSYYIVDAPNMFPEFPKFSHDKTRIVFRDIGDGRSENNHLAVYDLQTNKAEWMTIGSNIPFSWEHDDTAIFFIELVEPFLGIRNTYRYDLLSGSHELYLFHNYGIWYIREALDDDTYAIFAYNPSESLPKGLYFMDKSTLNITPINNPYLSFIYPNGEKRSFFDANWHPDKQLVVISELDTIASGYKISVTDYEGEFYASYTTGQYHDEFPEWGPDGKSILFHRRPINSTTFEHKIYVVDTETGVLRLFVEPVMIDSAVALGFPNY